jgi:hypothetical protein
MPQPYATWASLAVVPEFMLPMHALLREISPTADACLVLESRVSGEEAFSVLGGSAVGGYDVAGARRQTVSGRRC